MSKIAKVLLCTAMLVVLSACTTASEIGAKKYDKASVSMDWNSISKLTCTDYQTNIQSVGVISSLVTYIAPEVINSLTDTKLGDLVKEYKIDIGDIKYEETSNSGDQAVVHVTGKMNMTILHMPFTMPVDSDYYMVKEEGRWKWCGGTNNMDYESYLNDTLNDYEDIFNGLFNQ